MNFVPFCVGSDWQVLLEDELRKPYLLHLAAFIEKEYCANPGEVFPPKELIFNALHRTKFADVKVVIVGQDPYHNIGQAHGLSFSVPKGVKPPPSLVNIFKELKSDLQIQVSDHGCLLSWAFQGVLLLNATLTVKKNEPLSHHGKGWEQFTDAVIRKLYEDPRPKVFMLWGKSAQNKCKFLSDLKNQKSHLVLTAAHPSPFSAANGFFGCRHFSKANEFLTQHERKTIDWSLPQVDYTHP